MNKIVFCLIMSRNIKASSDRAIDVTEVTENKHSSFKKFINK